MFELLFGALAFAATVGAVLLAAVLAIAEHFRED